MIAALMRPPAAGENEERWLERAREAEARGPLGLHTHWTAPDHARPTAGDPAALVREQGEWLRAVGLDAGFFCGGGWYLDEDVAEAVAELGYTDCTATAFRPAFLKMKPEAWQAEISKTPLKRRAEYKRSVIEHARPARSVSPAGCPRLLP